MARTKKSDVKKSVERHGSGSDIHIDFGPNAETISTQLKEQGYVNLPQQFVREFQDDTDQLVRLYYRGVISRDVIKVARDVLLVRIINFVEEN